VQAYDARVMQEIAAIATGGAPHAASAVGTAAPAAAGEPAVAKGAAEAQEQPGAVVATVNGPSVAEETGAVMAGAGKAAAGQAEPAPLAAPAALVA
jgi:hypothetical protein